MCILFLKGLAIGFSIAAPVGPIGLLCIHRSLNNGFKIGFFTGLGAATADAVYGAVVGFGLTAISSFLVASKFWIQLLGGLFLIYLGASLLRLPKQERVIHNEKSISVRYAFGTTFLLTMTNPMTILSFVAVFAGLGIGTTSSEFADAMYLVFGVLIGSSLWWLLLSSGVSYVLHGKINKKQRGWINYLSSSVIILFGFIALTNCVKGIL